MTLNLDSRWKTFSIVLLFVAMALGITFIQAASAQQNTTPLGQLLQKSANVDAAKMASDKQPSIMIRVYGLQPSDIVNIRPRGTRLAASAGSLIKTLSQSERSTDNSLSQYAKVPYESFTPGPQLPESTLEVTSRMVTFLRPTLLDRVIFLDIEVPANAWLQLQVDEEVILNARLRQPLSFHNKEMGEGSQGISGTVMRAAMSLIGQAHFSEQSAYDRSKGAYAVPFSKLEIVKKTPINLSRSQSTIVMLQIDERGRVVMVTPMTDMPVGNLENTMKDWRFAPYEVNGQAVPVTTIVKISSHNP